MGRVLFFLALAVGVIVWLKWRAGQRAQRRHRSNPHPGPRASSGGAQDMVSCAHCGLHLPDAEALSEGSDRFCSEAHRRLGPKA
jgi:uncharacterized protein